jgi:hypothetical protein
MCIKTWLALALAHHKKIYSVDEMKKLLTATF